MTDDAVAEPVRALIARMAPGTPQRVADDERLIEDLGFDSIRLMELTLALERVFALPRQHPDDLADILRVADVVGLVRGAAAGERR